jgi:hypothetical protein
VRKTHARFKFLKHKRFLFIGIFITVFLFAGIYVYFYFTHLGLPPINTWPNYQGEGYSLKYPPGMEIRQALSGNDLLVQSPPVSTLIFIDPFRYPFSPSTQTFSDWYSKYIADQQHGWDVEKTGIKDLAEPKKLTDNKYQITFLANAFGSNWLFHKRTFLITNDHIVILMWRPLPKSFTDPWSFDKTYKGTLAYRSALSRQEAAYEQMVSTFSPTSSTPQVNIYTSPKYNGTYYSIPLPAGWIANPYSEYTGYNPLNNTLGVEFYKPEQKEWSWIDSNPSTRVQVKFIEYGEYVGPLEKYPEIAAHPDQVQFTTNHKGVPLANLKDGRVLLNFPANSICIFQLSYTKSDEVKEEFNNMVMNLDIYPKTTSKKLLSNTPTSVPSAISITQPPINENLNSWLTFTDNKHISFKYPPDWIVTGNGERYTIQPKSQFNNSYPDKNSINIYIGNHCLNTQCLTKLSLDEMVDFISASVINSAKAKKVSGYKVQLKNSGDKTGDIAYIFIKGEDFVIISTDVYNSYLDKMVTTLELLAK